MNSTGASVKKFRTKREEGPGVRLGRWVESGRSRRRQRNESESRGGKIDWPRPEYAAEREKQERVEVGAGGRRKRAEKDGRRKRPGRARELEKYNLLDRER